MEVCIRLLEKPTILNGISWNKKNDTMYFTDTVPNKVYAFDYVASTGSISNQRVFFHNNEPYFLDGHVRDEEDSIWHACYHGPKFFGYRLRGRSLERSPCQLATLPVPCLLEQCSSSPVPRRTSRRSIPSRRRMAATSSELTWVSKAGPSPLRRAILHRR